ncbi:MAG: type I 3-dehydroquinate dehydratase [Candidatus Cloacimonetes bacterium]|nr:type I 3-dehydroquinate dehydratase [Candidatus Cloacimonadota bacterium]
MIVLSLPFISTEFISAEISRNQTDFYEFRLDTYNGDLSSELVTSKTILTDRKRGVAPYIDIALQTGCMLDCENLETIPRNLPDKQLILSHHWYDDSWNSDDLHNFIDHGNTSRAGILKLAVYVSSYNQLKPILTALRGASKPVIFAGMGPLGKFSRIFFYSVYGYGTYTALPELPTATGQLSLKELALFNLPGSDTPAIGGLIGGEQVWDSLGINHFNNLFRQQKLAAVYLPFNVSDKENFLNWLDDFRDNLYGFSLTMPHKRLFTHKANLAFPEDNGWTLQNTDAIAFEKAAAELNLSPADRILIYGSGAVAETAIEVFSEKYKVSITGRNKATVKHLAKKFGLPTPFKNCNVIINCTPSGLLPLSLSLTSIEKVIDLPYGKKPTMLTIWCQHHGIPCINGREFWYFQAQEQEKQFLREIQLHQGG